MTPKDIILEQMAACHNKKNWFVPLSDAVNGLTAEQASWNAGNENHSVQQIINHLIFWNGRWLIRFKGGTPEKMEGENSATFSSDAASWEDSIKKLDQIFSLWEDALEKADEVKLQSEAFKDFVDNWYSVLHR
jgi:uncharacterized damage-inducible protein DinB